MFSVNPFPLLCSWVDAVMQSLTQSAKNEGKLQCDEIYWFKIDGIFCEHNLQSIFFTMESQETNLHVNKLESTLLPDKL